MLELKDLQVGLGVEAGWLRALDGLSLCIDRGQTFALVGESGCGKSMTALALVRLLPEAAPDALARFAAEADRLRESAAARDYRERLGLPREPTYPLHLTIGNLKPASGSR